MAGGEGERVLEGLGVVVEVPVVVAQHLDLVGLHDDRLSHLVDEAALDGGDDHVVAGMELVDVVERLAVGGAVPGDGGVALLAGPGRLGVVAGALLEVAHRDPFDEGPVEADGRDLDPAGGFALSGDELGRQVGDGRGRRRAVVAVGSRSGSDVVVVAPAAAAASSRAAKSVSRPRWAWAVRMLVPHSW